MKIIVIEITDKLIHRLNKVEDKIGELVENDLGFNFM